MIRRISEAVDRLDRHYTILRLVYEHEPIGIVNLAEITDLQQHEVRYSLRTLETDELIEPTRQGAVVTDRGVQLIAEFDRDRTEMIDRLEKLQTIHGLPYPG